MAKYLNGHLSSVLTKEDIILFKEEKSYGLGQLIVTPEMVANEGK